MVKELTQAQLEDRDNSSLLYIGRLQFSQTFYSDVALLTNRYAVRCHLVDLADRLQADYCVQRSSNTSPLNTTIKRKYTAAFDTYRDSKLIKPAVFIEDEVREQIDCQLEDIGEFTGDSWLENLDSSKDQAKVELLEKASLAGADYVLWTWTETLLESAKLTGKAYRIISPTAPVTLPNDEQESKPQPAAQVEIFNRAHLDYWKKGVGSGTVMDWKNRNSIK